MISFQWIPGPLSMMDSMICLHIPSSKLLSISFCSYFVRPPGFYFYSSADYCDEFRYNVCTAAAVFEVPCAL